MGASPKKALKQRHSRPKDLPSASRKEAILRELFDPLDVAIANVSPSGQILYANPRFLETLGVLARRNLTGSGFHELLAPASWEELDRALAEGMHGRVTGEIRVETLTDNPRTIRLTFSPARILKKTAIRVVATEVTELMEAERALKERESSLRSLSARILLVQDQERRKIARDLHDTTGQELAVLGMSLKQLADNLGHPAGEVRKSILDTVEVVRKINDEIRTVSYVLHPPLLDEFGLRSALKWYVEGFNKRSGINVTLTVPKNLARFTRDQETALFRTIQEGLTNIMRHSGTAKARIVVRATKEHVQITLEDEGKGIDAATLDRLSKGTSPMGVGIPGLRERLRQLGGGLEISSTPHGTKLTATLPIEEEAENAAEQADSELVIATNGEGSAAAQASGARKRILIVDDHEIVRHGIRSLLNEHADLEVCGEASNGAEAVQKTRELNPDLLILDLTMPGAGGLSAASNIHRASSVARILVCTSHDFPGMAAMIRAAGCQGFVLKANAARDLLRGVRAVLQGSDFYDPAARAQAV